MSPTRKRGRALHDFNRSISDGIECIPINASGSDFGYTSGQNHSDPLRACARPRWRVGLKARTPLTRRAHVTKRLRVHVRTESFQILCTPVADLAGASGSRRQRRLRFRLQSSPSLMVSRDRSKTITRQTGRVGSGRAFPSRACRRARQRGPLRLCTPAFLRLALRSAPSQVCGPDRPATPARRVPAPCG